MKKILFLHGFTSSGACDIANTLKEELVGVASVMAPDIPLHPYEAMDMLQDISSMKAKTVTIFVE